jgi:pimeloyl-ACP methyl ester carboxylesterase
MITAPSPVTGTLGVPGARLYYEVRGSGPLVALVAAPMDATSFAPLADLLATDHTVLTTDPRGINRSRVDDPDRDVMPADRADDVARLIAHLDAGPAAVLGSSGGAVTVLALAAARPELVATVVAHEPPLQPLLPDREELFRRTDEMIATYLAGDVRGAWRAFLEVANIAMPDEVFEAVFGGPREGRAAADERFQFEHMLRGTTRWEPDLARLTWVPARVVVGIGQDSAGELCDRASRALAAALGTEPAMFPGGHVGFADDPAAFARRLRAVLAESPPTFYGTA